MSSEDDMQGFAFCNFCPGICCYRLPGATLFVTATDINRMARHFGISDGEVRRRYLETKNTFKVREDGSCIFLHNGRLVRRCSIHVARPEQCRRFPYAEPCPYLHNDGLLEQIFPRIAASLGEDGASLFPLQDDGDNELN